MVTMMTLSLTFSTRGATSVRRVRLRPPSVPPALSSRQINRLSETRSPSQSIPGERPWTPSPLHPSRSRTTKFCRCSDIDFSLSRCEAMAINRRKRKTGQCPRSTRSRRHPSHPRLRRSYAALQLCHNQLSGNQRAYPALHFGSDSCQRYQSPCCLGG